jgi:hypothetical protein
MHRIKNKRFIVLLFSFFVIHLSYGQYVGEIGLLGGVSYYNGDANSTKPFLENHPAFGAILKLRMSPLALVKFDVMRAAVSGNTENFSNKLPLDQQVSFKRDFWEIGAHLELNFFKYGPKSWDREIKQHTPYILLGPGLALYQNANGNALSPNMTFGVGYKFKILDRLNIGAEWSLRKLFIDDFDVTDSSNRILDDPYGVGHTWYKNNDWYSCAFVFITFDIIKKRGQCIEMR